MKKLALTLLFLLCLPFLAILIILAAAFSNSSHHPTGYGFGSRRK